MLQLHTKFIVSVARIGQMISMKSMNIFDKSHILRCSIMIQPPETIHSIYNFHSVQDECSLLQPLVASILVNLYATYAHTHTVELVFTIRTLDVARSVHVEQSLQKVYTIRHNAFRSENICEYYDCLEPPVYRSKAIGILDFF